MYRAVRHVPPGLIAASPARCCLPMTSCTVESATTPLAASCAREQHGSARGGADQRASRLDLTHVLVWAEDGGGEDQLLRLCEHAERVLYRIHQLGDRRVRTYVHRRPLTPCRLVDGHRDLRGVAPPVGDSDEHV